jgi:hypothetical protein
LRPLRMMLIDEAEWLSQDPTFRLIESEKTWDRGAVLSSPAGVRNGDASRGRECRWLARINHELIGKVEALDSPLRVALDTTKIQRHFSSITRSNPIAFQAMSFQPPTARMEECSNIGRARTRFSISSITSSLRVDHEISVQDIAGAGGRACARPAAADLPSKGCGDCTRGRVAGSHTHAGVLPAGDGAGEAGAVSEGAVMATVTG